MVEVRRNAEVDGVARHLLPVHEQLIDHAVEVVVGAEIENRTADLADGVKVVDGVHVERRLIRWPAGRAGPLPQGMLGRG